ncbi:hypothetical protein M3152_14405 [Sporosarcina luteola]|uniref:hypothetical protein n=1 Tax=Sporosarcina luteola TaxID=582850 RepID=UPI00203CA776|nr:hypothetical protein [Sporosarcina luteola]MCM3638891.1 hypothetical protein [Sporosarcina luteola]
MEEQKTSNYDIVIYALAFFSAILLFIFSNKLSAPLILEINSGTPIFELMFNSEKSISMLSNLVFPLLMMIAGVIILSKTLWKMAIYILFEVDILTNKIILSILLVIFLALIVNALLNTWVLFKTVVLFTIASFIVLAVFGSLLNNSSATHR